MKNSKTQISEEDINDEEPFIKKAKKVTTEKEVTIEKEVVDVNVDIPTKNVANPPTTTVTPI